jgi:hypothetical protein
MVAPDGLPPGSDFPGARCGLGLLDAADGVGARPLAPREARDGARRHDLASPESLGDKAHRMKSPETCGPKRRRRWLAGSLWPLPGRSPTHIAQPAGRFRNVPVGSVDLGLGRVSVARRRRAGPWAWGTAAARRSIPPPRPGRRAWALIAAPCTRLPSLCPGRRVVQTHFWSDWDMWASSHWGLAPNQA